jgi:hypothetical protein
VLVPIVQVELIATYKVSHLNTYIHSTTKYVYVIFYEEFGVLLLRSSRQDVSVCKKNVTLYSLKELAGGV